jgi:hypothetical protein
MMSTARFVFGAIVMGLAACSPKQPDPLDSPIEGGTASPLSAGDAMPAPAPIGVAFGSSFGQCYGYCLHEFTLHTWGIVGVRKAWPGMKDEYPDQTIWAVIGPERLNKVIAAIDTTDLGQALERLGCPDCSDGGSCWITIDRPGRSKSLDYDCMHGAGPWKYLSDLLNSLDPSPVRGDGALPLPGLPKWE